MLLILKHGRVHPYRLRPDGGKLITSTIVPDAIFGGMAPMSHLLVAARLERLAFGRIRVVACAMVVLCAETHRVARFARSSGRQRGR